MADTLNPSAQGHLAALVNHPAYYYLFGLYTDYPLNSAFHLPLESRRELQVRLREIQPLLWKFEFYRKSYALRLFTERAALARFSPEQVDEAWRQLRQVIDELGPPPRWAESRTAPRGEPQTREPPRGSAQGMARETAPREAEAGETRAAPKAPWPRSPVDYDQEA